MAHYLIYFPGLKTPDDNHFAVVGLESLKSTGLPIQWHEVLAQGPDGGHGMIAAWARGDDRDLSPSAHQAYTWTPSKRNRPKNYDACRFYFGIDPSRPVTPYDIELPCRFKGHDVLCEDGNKWHIPAAVRLPHSHGLNEDGAWERKVAKEYSEFATTAYAYGTKIFTEIDALEVLRQSMPEMKDSDHALSIELDETDVHCCNALAMNYRLCPEIIDILGLLDDMTMIAIISATIDLPEITDVLSQKKRYSPVAIPVG